MEALDELIASISGDSRPRPRSTTTTYKPRGSEAERRLRIVEQQNDPLEPPRHRYQKPRPFDNGSLVLATHNTKAPILRPAPKKLTKEQKQEWDIPQSVSNWKNGRGFLIDLDRRASQTPNRSAPVNVSKQADLAEALSRTSEELAEERNETDNKQQRLREKLRAQRETARNPAAPTAGAPKEPLTEAAQKDPETEDLFDSRLFHASSRKRHDLYDSSFFTDRKRSKTTKPVQFERGSS